MGLRARPQWAWQSFPAITPTHKRPESGDIYGDVEMDVDVDDADGKWEREWKWRSCSCDKPYLQQLPPRCGNSGNGSYTYHAQKYATLLSA